MKKVIIAMLTIFLYSCNSSNKESDLEKKEIELLKRENEILKKEKEIQEPKTFTESRHIAPSDGQLVESATQNNNDAQMVDSYEVKAPQRANKFTKKDWMLHAKGLKTFVLSKRPVGLGGFKDVMIELNNETPFKFNSITVRVKYLKPYGVVYKEEEIIFYNIKPQSMEVTQAPDSDRGIEIKANIISIDSPDMPKDI